MALHREIEISQQGDPGFVRYRLGPSRLYLNDVELIHTTLVKAAKERADSLDTEAAEVRITARDATADAPGDLRDATLSELQRVRISVEAPLISVDLWSENADVSAQASDAEGKAVAEGIKKFVDAKRSLRGGYQWLDGTHDVVLLISGIALAASSFFVFGDWRAALASFLGACFVTFGFNSTFAYRTGTVRIVPRNESEVRKLSSETRKQLWIALAGAAAGALIVGTAGLWAGFAVK
ncbi:hypothetical protein [Streptomyces sp. NPDC088812]|uniref:hypothetical protein n=1 Tax=Streptomyces sp. NPDC088812 TaxID=3365905 RepID=UPI003801B965